MRERRKELERRRRRLAIRFRAAGTEQDFRGGFSDDVSPRGLFVHTAFSLPPGQEVEVILDLPHGPQRLLGTVTWARRAPVGLSGRKRSGMGIRLRPGQPGLDDLAS